MSVNVYFFKSEECCVNRWLDLNETHFRGLGYWNKMGIAWMETYQGGLYAYGFEHKHKNGHLQLISVKEILDKWDEFEKQISIVYPLREGKSFLRYWFDRMFKGDKGWACVWETVIHTKRELKKMPKDLILFVDAG